MARVCEKDEVIIGDDWPIEELPDGLQFVATITSRPRHVLGPREGMRR
jgi:hypothetical protein